MFNFKGMQMQKREFEDRMRELRDLNEQLLSKLEDDRELIACLDAAYPEIVRDARWAVARMREAQAAEEARTTMTIPVTLEDADRVLREQAKKRGRLAEYEKLKPGDVIKLQIEVLEDALRDERHPPKARKS